VLAASNRDVLKRNMSALPIYSLALGLIAMLGYMAIAAGTKPIGTDGNTIVPELFQSQFPSWFAGIAFAAVAIGALVPAAIMSIAAANLFTRNIYKEFLKRDATPRQEASVAKITSLVVKLGAVAAIIFINPQFSIDLQLIGGVIILQTLPSVALGLYTRWLHRGALITGWVAGMVAGLWMVYEIPKLNPDGTVARAHFGGSSFALSKLGFDTKLTMYAGFLSLLVNLVVVLVVTVVLRAMKVPEGVDGTAETDYTAEREDPTVRDLPDPLSDEPLAGPPPAGGRAGART
jgi:SSS family solute:Na+ symporter